MPVWSAPFHPETLLFCRINGIFPEYQRNSPKSFAVASLFVMVMLGIGIPCKSKSLRNFSPVRFWTAIRSLVSSMDSFKENLFPDSVSFPLSSFFDCGILSVLASGLMFNLVRLLSDLGEPLAIFVKFCPYKLSVFTLFSFSFCDIFTVRGRSFLFLYE